MAGPIEHSAAMEEAGPLWQLRVSHQGVSLIHQQAIPPASIPDNPDLGFEEASVPIYASTEPAAQVSTSEMLIVRDTHGRAIATEMICIFGPLTLPAEMRSLLEPLALEQFQQWRVMFRTAQASNDAA